jgi:hypothetical protein
VITRWSTSLTSGGYIASLRTYTGSNPVYTPTAESGPESVLPAGPTQFETRIPVSGGEVLGLKFSGSMASFGCYYNTGPNPNDKWHSGSPAGTLGQSQSYSANTGVRVNVSAVVEPDCDSDGFGDETQDQDILACGIPNTTITAGPKDKTKKKQATFEFSADIPGSTFECRLDAAAFQPCSSPFSVTVKKGRHSFQVQAKSAFGGTDGSPATDDWKVKKKKKK